MVDFDLKQVLFEELGYDNNPNIQEIDQPPTGRAVPYVEQIYKVQDVQVAYFCRFEAVDLNKLWELHRAVWNESSTPLLFVVLPHEIRVYNGYALPSHSPDSLDDGQERLLRHLSGIVDIEEARKEVRLQLYENSYDRLHLETGAFWETQDGKRVDKTNRADNRLLRAMDILRQQLSRAGLHQHMNYAYALIGRSIFARYLEDRNILHTVGPDSARLDQSRVISLLRNKSSAYEFFEVLSQRFGGDLFPVLDNEKQIINESHLNLVAAFLEGTDLETGQMSFWPYDFAYIPVELVSGIYDTFLNTSDKKGAGTYYTPHTLADFVLEETMPPELVKSNMKILDPACGSGVFLVRAYQRLIAAWIRENDGSQPSVIQLTRLIKENIYGIDIDENAVRIASFSLYLAMIDNLDNATLGKGNVFFPKLRNENLLVGDFFDLLNRDQLGNLRFDRIIGNPPWVTELTDAASEWIARRGYIIGDKQIAQAFLLAVPSLCDEKGEIALLAPTKGTVAVTSGPHSRFRQSFIETHKIRALFNLSALCYELFEDAIHPTVVIFYSSQPPDLDQKFVYLTPKPTSLFKQMGSIVIEAMDVKYLTPRRAIDFPHIWKIALWGTPRDEAFIEKLNRLPRVKEVIDELGFHMAEGIQIGGGDENAADWLVGMSLVPTTRVQKYSLDETTFESISERVFHRPRTEELIRGPMVLIRQSPASRIIAAAFHEGDIAFRDKITGISGHKNNILKWIVAYLNSPLAKYYHFMTSASWAVERGNIIHMEYENMPFFLPESEDPRFIEAVALVDEVIATLSNHDGLDDSNLRKQIDVFEQRLSEIVFELFGVFPIERQLVYDTINYTMDFFYWGKRKTRTPKSSVSTQNPTRRILSDYAENFVQAANRLMRYQQHYLTSVIYQNGTPLTIVEFKRMPTDGAQVQSNLVETVDSSQEIRQVLKRLDSALLEQKVPSLYMRRQVRIYDANSMYVIRPSERRFWTKSQALVDADEALAEWLLQSPTSEIPEGAMD